MNNRIIELLSLIYCKIETAYTRHVIITGRYLRQRQLTLSHQEKALTAEIILDKVISWCKLQQEGHQVINEYSLFETINEAWKNRLVLWDALNPFVRETLNIQHFYPDEISVKETIGGLCRKLTDKISIPFELEQNYYAHEDILDYIPPDAQITKPTIFILSSPRSGSTLFRTMLAGHPELNAPPELHLLGFKSMKSRERSIVKAGTIWMLYGLMQTIANQMKISEDEAFALLSIFTQKDMPIQRIYELIHSSSSKPILVEKTPFMVRSLAIMRQSQLMFNNPKYIHLVRHPGAVIESLERMRHILDPTIEKRHKTRLSRLNVSEKEWNTQNKSALKFLSSLPTSQHTTVVYENLVHNTESEIRRVADFIGVAFHESMLDPYSGERLIHGIGDPNITNHNKVNPQLAHSWKTNLCGYTLEAETTELAKQLGIPN